jgi:DnaK suppressor protein
LVNDARGGVAIIDNDTHRDREDFMSLPQEELLALQRALVARARMLRGEVSGKLGDAADDAGGMNAGGDFGDQSYASSESSLDIAEAQRDIVELQGIDAALHAISEGSYGFCTSCGDEIPVERLRVQPLALRCVRCQERSERTRAERPSSI